MMKMISNLFFNALFVNVVSKTAAKTLRVDFM